jgi:pimeloyl-ACP methyl ester carboxylesterase
MPIGLAVVVSSQLFVSSLCYFLFLQITIVMASKNYKLYKSESSRQVIMALYEKKLQELRVAYKSIVVPTSVGDTHVLVAGSPTLPPIVLLHGLNAGAALTLEVLQELTYQYCVYAIDTIGQTNKSAEVILPVHDESYGIWLHEVVKGLHIDRAIYVSVSYGAFVLQKLIAYKPEIIEKVIFVVPSGLANSDKWSYTRQLLIPMLTYWITKKEQHLLRFLSAFYTEIDADSVALQRELLSGVNMDFRRPPEFGTKQADRLDAPVFAILAQNDVFFPASKTLKRCQELFKNFREAQVLDGIKHVPSPKQYPQIVAQIEKWLQED